MRQFIKLIPLLLAAGIAVSIFTACKSQPLSGETQPVPSREQPDPPPPPPSPPEPAAAVDASPPVISVSLSPQPFSPDGDGVDDILTVRINVTSASEVGGWHIEIREPVYPFNLFSEWYGVGRPPAVLQWDGLSATGELVQSAHDYHFALIVSNAFDTAIFQGTFETDVLVHREDGNILRIIVPSIIFPPNAVDFDALDNETRENNSAILGRIAEILNHFSAYRITVEGHANPATAPGTRARETEENGTRNMKGLRQYSEERAAYIVNYLINNFGIDGERLSAIGMGGTRPVVTDHTDRDNWWKNRRVEFILER